MILGLLWLVPAAPLAGALLLGLGGQSLGARLAGAIGCGSVALAASIALGIGFGWLGSPPPNHVFVQSLWSWIALPDLSIRVALYLDPVSLLMMLTITVVGFLIHLFSAEYMAGEEGYSRYFAYLNLFVAAMLLLVLADDLVLLFVGWEGVGVCSYLLVGFWFRDAANGYAARKSFLVTRVADIFMLVGLLLISVKLGTLSIQAMLAAAVVQWPAGGAWPTLAAALLLIGGLGKSAQLPLQTWLPDAMAGPTPVSALLHAATMVTAGVYLVVRTHALFLLAPDILRLIAIGATATSLVASLAALAQSDIKRVLAYSTISQIGLMFLALGVGAWSAAMFHFLTHALFKALLFLSAGAIAMRLHHEQNIFRMGGLAARIPLAFAAFAIGGASLAGLPLISAGGFSKEMVLASVWAAPGVGPVLWLAAIVGAAITATYIFRVIFVVFLGPVRTEISGGYGIGVGLPLILLGIGALTAGWLQTASFLGGISAISGLLSPAVGPLAQAAEPNTLVSIAGFGAPILGAVVAYVLYRDGYWHRQYERPPGAAFRLMRSGFGFDGIYDRLFVRPFLALVRALRDDPIDLVFVAIARTAIDSHRRLKLGHVGPIRRYAGWLMLGSIAAVTVLVFI